MHVLNASPKKIVLFCCTSMKKMHDTVCIAIFLLAQKFLIMYFTELYQHVMFSKLLDFNEKVW